MDEAWFELKFDTGTGGCSQEHFSSATTNDLFTLGHFPCHSKATQRQLEGMYQLLGIKGPKEQSEHSSILLPIPRPPSILPAPQPSSRQSCDLLLHIHGWKMSRLIFRVSLQSAARMPLPTLLPQHPALHCSSTTLTGSR